MKKQGLIYSLAFVLLIAFGVLYNLAIANEKAKADDIINMVTDLGVTRLELDMEAELLTDLDTEILEIHKGYQGDELKAIIYIGITTGFQEDLKVAYAIDVATDSIVAVKIVSSNETPSYIAMLFGSTDFTDQFTTKSLSAKPFEIDVISGTTPNGTENDIIAPSTVRGMEKIMRLVRLQYANDTGFRPPSEIEFVSSRQNLEKIEEFIYTLDADGVEVTVVVDQSYALISITHAEHQEEAMNIINRNKIENYVSSMTYDENTKTHTILIRSKGYGPVFTSTATVVDGVLTGFVSNLNQETYDHDYNDSWLGGDPKEKFNDVINFQDIDETSVAGATITVRGIKRAQTVLYAYLEVLLDE